jgi:hypothetical protein
MISGDLAARRLVCRPIGARAARLGSSRRFFCWLHFVRARGWRDFSQQRRVKPLAPAGDSPALPRAETRQLQQVIERPHLRLPELFFLL